MKSPWVYKALGVEDNTPNVDDARPTWFVVCRPTRAPGHSEPCLSAMWPMVLSLKRNATAYTNPHPWRFNFFFSI